ncbi:MAG: GNAT family N-acetyltransferase [Sulfitobacter sp.]
MFHSVPHQDHPLQQDPAFASALRLFGRNPHVLPSGLVLLYRRIAGVPVAMLPRALPPPELRQQLTAAGLGRVPLILSPERPVPCRGLPLRRGWHSAELDLTRSEHARRAVLHGKWRNQLRRAEVAGLRVENQIFDSNSNLIERNAAQGRARGYAPWPIGLTRAFAIAAPGQTRLFTAKLDGKIVAEMLFFLHGTRATYHIGLTTPEGRHWHAHNLLLWQAQNWLAKREIRRLDLGILHPSTPTLNRFKLRCGAARNPMGDTFLLWTPFKLRD